MEKKYIHNELIFLDYNKLLQGTEQIGAGK